MTFGLSHADEPGHRISNRLQCAAEALKNYDFRPIFTVRDFGIEPVAG